jgi:hypothetical protein
MIPSRIVPVPARVLAAAAIAAALAAVPARAAVVERFAADPLAGLSANPFFADGDVASHFVFLAAEPPHFPGDRTGTLRVTYDTTLPAGRIATPLGQVLSLDDDFSFGAILTVRSEGFDADPAGFDQIAFGLWNGHTTGLARTTFPADSYDLVEWAYFPNVSPDFGGPFLSPTVFGGNVADNAFFNFSFQSSQVSLPLDVPLLCRARYRAADRTLTVNVSRGVAGGRRTPGFFFQPIPGASVVVDLSRLSPTFLVDRVGIAAYTEGFPSLHAVVDYDLLYTGDLPLPFGARTRRAPVAADPSGPSSSKGQPARPGACRAQ